VGALVGLLMLSLVALLASAVAALWTFTAVHETGHALCAKALGQRVYSVQMGFGRAVVTMIVRGVPVAFHLLPGAGATRYQIPSDRAPALRMGLIATAGPMANIVVGAAALWLATPLAPGREFDLLLWIGLFNVGLGLVNLIPVSPRRRATMGSDGWVIVTEILHTPHARERRSNAAARVAAADATRAATDLIRVVAASRRTDDYVAALTAARHALDLVSALASPKRTAFNRLLLAFALVLQTTPSTIEEAKALCGDVLEDRHLSGEVRGVVANELAWAIATGVTEAVPGEMETAERWARLSCELPGNAPAYGDTLALVLVRRERYADALEAARSAADRMESDSVEHRASNLCVQALATFGLGNHDDAVAMHRQANGLDPTCPLLAEVADTLSRQDQT
jgi:tetratricopeptide (TPR) repeat protein